MKRSNLLILFLLVLVGCGGPARPSKDPKSKTEQTSKQEDEPNARTDDRSARPEDAQELLQRIQQFYAKQQQIQVEVLREHKAPKLTDLPTETARMQVKFVRPFYLFVDAEEVGEPRHSFRLFNHPEQRTLVIDALNQYHQGKPYRGWEDLRTDTQLRVSVGMPDLLLWKLLQADWDLENTQLALGKRIKEEGESFDTLTLMRGSEQYLFVIRADKEKPYVRQAQKVVFDAAFPLGTSARKSKASDRSDVTSEFYRNWQTSSAGQTAGNGKNPPTVSANLPSDEPVKASAKIAEDIAEEFRFQPTQDDYEVKSFAYQRDVWSDRHHRVVGGLLPEWSLTGLAGERFGPQQYMRGKHLIGYIGHPDLKDTAEDLKLLNSLYLEFFGQEFKFLALFMRAKADEIRAVIRQSGLDIDAAALANTGRDKQFPTSAGPIFFLVDRHGVLRQLHVGRRSDLEVQLRAEIRTLLSRERYASELLSDVQSENVSGATLVAALGHEFRAIQGLAAQKLRRMGKDAVEPLREGLRHPDQSVRAASAGILGTMGKEAESAILDLIGRLGESSFRVRYSAAYALSQIVDAESLQALTDALDDSNYKVRIDAARTIGMMRTRARTAIPVLIRSLDDSNELVRENVIRALASMGEESMPALGAALQEKDELVHSGAREALQMMGPRAVDTLIKALRSDLPYVRTQVAMAADNLPEYYANRVREAINSQEQIRALETKNVRELIETFGNQKQAISLAAADAVANKAQEDKKVLDLLRDVADSPSAQIRLMVAHCLRQIGPEAFPASDTLVQLAGDRNSQVRTEASAALGSLGKKVLPKLQAAWKGDLSEEKQLGLLNAFAALGPASEPALNTIFQALQQSQSAEIQVAAAEALAKIGTPGVDKLLTLVDSDNRNLRSIAGDALALGGESAVKPLIAATEHQNWVVRQWAAIALGRIGSPDALPALQALQQLADSDPKFDVRSYAEEALNDIERSTN